LVSQTEMKLSGSYVKNDVKNIQFLSKMNCHTYKTGPKSAQKQKQQRKIMKEIHFSIFLCLTKLIGIHGFI